MSMTARLSMTQSRFLRAMSIDCLPESLIVVNSSGVLKFRRLRLTALGSWRCSGRRDRLGSFALHQPHSCRPETSLKRAYVSRFAERTARADGAAATAAVATRRGARRQRVGVEGRGVVLLGRKAWGTRWRRSSWRNGGRASDATGGAPRALAAEYGVMGSGPPDPCAPAPPRCGVVPWRGSLAAAVASVANQVIRVAGGGRDHAVRGRRLRSGDHRERERHDSLVARGVSVKWSGPLVVSRTRGPLAGGAVAAMGSLAWVRRDV